jgi:2-phospho-L-lactate guanylyltransferase
MSNPNRRIWAIVPLKSLDRAKQRLASVLSADERRALMLAMARDVLTSLARSTELSGTLIVSRTPEADALSQAFGTERFAESPDADLPEALTQAADYLREQLGGHGAFIVPADVPLITEDDVDRAIRAHAAVTIVPDAENLGTNGLILSPVDAIPLVFDGKSFKPHLDAAEAAGITPKIAPLPSFALDIDSPQDLKALLQLAPHTQTSTYLDRSGIAERLQALDNVKLSKPNTSKRNRHDV